MRQRLSEGQFMSLLRSFEGDLHEDDIQRIRRDLDKNGKNKAIGTFVSCLVNCGRRCFKKFIAYLKENNDELYKQFEVKCRAYGVEDLLQKSGHRIPDEKGTLLYIVFRYCCVGGEVMFHKNTKE